MRKTPLKTLLEIEFQLRVQLKGSLTLASELSRLKKGDILKLNQKLSDPFMVTINKAPCFKAWPASCQQYKAILIKERHP